MKVLVLDLAVAAVGTVAGASVNDYTGFVTAGAAAFYLACKGVVLVIRELRKK